jgi:hypothetical protein
MKVMINSWRGFGIVIGLIPLSLTYYDSTVYDCNTHFLRIIKFCRSSSALCCILKINSIG